MPNYQLGKIYKIISDQTEKIYIGSTTKKYLSDRMSQHRWDYKIGKNKSSKKIIRYDDAKIILIEKYPCGSIEELHAREQYWINENKDICVNKYVAYTGLTSKEYQKEYFKIHAKKIIPCLYCDCEIKSPYNIWIHNRRKKHIANKKYFDNLFNNLD